MKSTFSFLHNCVEVNLFPTIRDNADTDACKSSSSIDTMSTWSLQSLVSATSSFEGTNEPVVEIERGINNDSSVEVQLKVPSRSSVLPAIGHFANNHIMVNCERTKKNLRPLTRKSELDAFARRRAETMAAANDLFHTDRNDLKNKIGHQSNYLGESVARGPSIRIIHKQMVERTGDLTNMLKLEYGQMGMATARGANSELYLCQIFRGQ